MFVQKAFFISLMKVCMNRANFIMLHVCEARLYKISVCISSTC